MCWSLLHDLCLKKLDYPAPDVSGRGRVWGEEDRGSQDSLQNWNSDRLSPHTSGRTSQGFNLALQYHTSPHPCPLIGPKFPRHRPLLGGSALPALRSLLLPNQLAFTIDILMTVCVDS